MHYKAEIFDKFQYLYDITGFSDHQIHCIINFEGKTDESAMKKAARLLLKMVPILSRVYRNHGGKSYWEDVDSAAFDDLFTVVSNKEEFDKFSCSKTDEAAGPQIKFCLLQSENDSLSVIINHMVSDAGGFKQCMYLFSEIYSNLVDDPAYEPDYIIDGDRSFKNIVSTVGLFQKIKLLLFSSRDNNQKSEYKFPLSETNYPQPFLVSHELSTKAFIIIKELCKSKSVTVNDVILTAYFRALSSMLSIKKEELSIPIMIDMRKYLQDKSFNALTNLASTSIIKLQFEEGESFNETLTKVNSVMSYKKKHLLGMNTFVKLDTGFKIPIVDAYEIMRKVLKNPNISMTNIGIVDSTKLDFKYTQVQNAVIYASKKYNPHFQLSLSSFEGKMTFGSGLYGDMRDKANIEKLFELIEFELLSIMN